MSYYHLPANTARNPGRLETKLSDGCLLGPPDTGWTDELAVLCGFVPIIEIARPDDTATDTYDRTVTLVAGVPTVVWTQRAKTAGELAGDKAVTNEATIGTAGLTLTQADLRTLQQQVKDLARIERREIKKLLRLLDTAT